VELVSAGLGYHVHDRVQSVAVLRIELIAIDLELLDSVLAHVDDRNTPHAVVKRRAVDDRGVTARLVRHAAELSHGEARGCHVEVHHWPRTRHGLGNHQKIPVQDRQLREFLMVDHGGRLRLSYLNLPDVPGFDSHIGSNSGQAE
jgi:hypothetical protein